MEQDPDFPTDVYLEVAVKDREVFLFPINKKSVTIGRDPGCDLHLSDPYVSRKHCQVVFRGDHFTVIDLGSLNKTVVKGKRYIEKNLMPGNLINLGETRLRFLWEGSIQWRRDHADKSPLGGEQPGPGPDIPEIE